MSNVIGSSKLPRDIHDTQILWKIETNQSYLMIRLHHEFSILLLTLHWCIRLSLGNSVRIMPIVIDKQNWNYRSVVRSSLFMLLYFQTTLAKCGDYLISFCVAKNATFAGIFIDYRKTFFITHNVSILLAKAV